MKVERCPHCRTRDLQPYLVVSGTTAMWPTALIFASTALIAAGLLQVDARMAIFFALIAAFPVLFKTERRLQCLECGMEFEPESGLETL